MDVAISPDPRPGEREAIEAALRKLIRGDKLPPAYTSAWRRAGLEQVVADQAAARPRTSFGATRA